MATAASFNLTNLYNISEIRHRFKFITNAANTGKRIA